MPKPSTKAPAKKRNPYGKKGPMAAPVVKGRDRSRDLPQPDKASGIFTVEEYAAREKAKAQTSRDTPPVATTSEPKPTGKPTADTIKQGVQRTIRRTPQKALVAELLAAVVLTSVREVADGNSPGIQPFVGAFAVYLVLGFAAEIGGEQTARVAAGLGGLVLLAIAARTVGPLIRSGEAIANPQVQGLGGGGGKLAGPGSGVRTMGPHGGVHHRPPGTRLRGNSLNDPTRG